MDSDLETVNNFKLSLKAIESCRKCEGRIPEPNPIVRLHPNASILIIGQAPGIKVHESKVPWNDASGKRLREWMGVSDDEFYDVENVALVPMGFCYPGKGKSGDLPPRKECAPKWHPSVMNLLPNVEVTLLIGAYAQSHYLQDEHKTLTDRVKAWHDLAPRTFVLPHPSPRNQFWLTRNEWFTDSVVPAMQKIIRQQLK
jgi:uracil-DNA glycosylase